MIRGEDFLFLSRSLKRKPLETLMLILGIALGVGATTAGLSLAAQSRKLSNEIIRLPEYREIGATGRSQGADMVTPAVTINDNQVILTAGELAAAEEAPDVAWAYLSRPTRIRTSMNSSRPPEEEGQPASDQPRRFPDNQEFSAEAASLQKALEKEPQPLVDEISGFEVSPEFFNARELIPARGSLFTLQDMEKSAPYMVVGSGLAKTLFDDGESLNRKILNFRIIYTIIGILEPTGTALDYQALVPSRAMNEATLPGGAIRMMGMDQSLRFSVEDPDRLDEAASQLQSWFDREMGEGTVSLSVPREAARRTADRNNRLTTLILFLALSALFIATVNVSNILLGRALKKQKSVGILKALGASRKGIFLLFFKEALIIDALGTAAGILLALGLTPLMSRSMGFSALSPLGTALGLGLSLVVTLGFTLLPALKASKIAPADAVKIE